MALIEHAVPGMRERGFGRILERVLERRARADPGAAALDRAPQRAAGHLQAARRELAGDGITLNTLLPGRIATDRLAELYGSIEAAEEVAATQVPAGRLGSVEEIAAAGAFLCSAQASYITGVALAVDGGLIRAT